MRLINIDKNKLRSNANDLIVNNDSKDTLSKSFSLLKVNRKNLGRKVVFVVLELLVSIIVAQQVTTISIVKEIVEVLISVMLALLAIVFTGYAFFQALLNDRLLIALISDDTNKRNKLVETNSYFVEVMMLQIFCLAINILVIIMMIILPSDWSWLANNEVNELIAAGLLFLYLHLNVECIWEMKSFIFNTFQLFNLYAYSRISNIVNEEKDKD